jgi:hypothetical protein
VSKPVYKMMDLPKQTEMNSPLSGLEDSPVSRKSQRAPSGIHSFTYDAHVPFTFAPSFSLPSHISPPALGSPASTCSSSLRIPSPTPLAKSGVRIVKSFSLQEIATSVHGNSNDSSSLASLLLPLTTFGIDNNIIGQKTPEESLFRLIESYNPAAIEEEKTHIIDAGHVELSAGNDECGPLMRSSEHEARQCHASLEDQHRYSEQWDMNFASLQEYKRRFGHCNVPYLWEHNKPLSQWVKRQRHQKKLKDQGRHSNLTDHRENLLRGIGFCWDSRDSAWDERFQELRRFHRAHGHCRVTRSNHPTLAVWLKRQRHQSRNYFSGHLDGSENSITAARIAKLLDLGVDLNVDHAILLAKADPPAQEKGSRKFPVK